MHDGHSPATQPDIAGKAGCGEGRGVFGSGKPPLRVHLNLYRIRIRCLTKSPAHHRTQPTTYQDSPHGHLERSFEKQQRPARTQKKDWRDMVRLSDTKKDPRK
ncbi:hypothetical protein NDU88_000348 [Pleurodeles waltl]|uniref:Uncharacterized protein n=1 Tax=Pleurodeles waltl TaxID=8319 RepID=A0AAV7VUF2_PLEWA|nr:hypothetical protein NDU88_000348 [Pleurodeles waltl]